MSPIYLASYKAINITGIRATLTLRFQLACGLEDEVMCVVNISAGRNSNNLNFPAFSQTHKIAKNANNRSNLFDSMEVFLNFSNIRMGIDYFVRAQLLNSEGVLIGPEHQRTIIIPQCEFSMAYVCTQILVMGFNSFTVQVCSLINYAIRIVKNSTLFVSTSHLLYSTKSLGYS